MSDATPELPPLPELHPGTPSSMRPWINGLVVVAIRPKAVLLRRDGGTREVWFPRSPLNGVSDFTRPGDRVNVSVTVKLYNEKRGLL